MNIFDKIIHLPSGILFGLSFGLTFGLTIEWILLRKNANISYHYERNMEYLKQNFIKDFKNRFLQLQYDMELKGDKRINEVENKMTGYQEDILMRLNHMEHKYKKNYHYLMEKMDILQKKQNELNQEMNKIMDIFMEYVSGESQDEENSNDSMSIPMEVIDTSTLKEEITSL